MSPTYGRLHFQLDSPTKKDPHPEIHTVEYYVFGSQVMFTGISAKDGRMHYSTVSHAELIIDLIIKDAKIYLAGHKFFDLQTRLNCPWIPAKHYVLSRLDLTIKDDKITNVTWKEGHGTRSALRYFAGYINGGDPDGPMVNYAIKKGLLKPIEECSAKINYDDIISMMIYAGDKLHEGDHLYEEYMERVVKIMTAFCDQLGITNYDFEIFKGIQKRTQLGPKAEAAYDELCKWLLDSGFICEDDTTEYIFLE